MTPENRAYFMKKYEEESIAYEDAKRLYDENKKKFNVDFKGVKAPGFGEWVKVESSGHLAGSSSDYSHPNHPEWGKVSIYTFGGWRMQHVAASSYVEYNGFRFEWAGSTARDRANAFINKYFGV